MAVSIIPKHKRRIKGKWRTVRAFKRKKRGIGKKRIIGKTPVKLYPLMDEYHQRLGWVSKK